MKFIHIADVHWGMNPDSDRPWSRERAQAIRDSFAEVVRQARLRDADCLFISGDLFHRQPLLRDLKEVNYLFSTIPGVRVVIIAGNHDRIRLQFCADELYLVSQCHLPHVRRIKLRLL
ncbi:MAG: metallophosphoesterase family protein [Clostridium sp.]